MLLLCMLAGSTSACICSLHCKVWWRRYFFVSKSAPQSGGLHAEGVDAATGTLDSPSVTETQQHEVGSFQTEPRATNGTTSIGMARRRIHENLSCSSLASEVACNCGKLAVRLFCTPLRVASVFAIQHIRCVDAGMAIALVVAYIVSLVVCMGCPSITERHFRGLQQAIVLHEEDDGPHLIW